MNIPQNYNLIDVKKSNRQIVLKQICLSQPVSRITLSRVLNLKKMTVTNCVNDLIADGYVYESRVDNNLSYGRNPILLDLSPSAPKVIGVSVSRQSVSVVLADLKLNILFERVLPISKDIKVTELESKIFPLIDEVLKKFKNSKIAYIGIISPGPIDKNNGIILNPPSFENIRNYHIVSAIQNKYNIPVVFDKDTNAAAILEKLFGNGVNFDDFISLSISNIGIGSSAVIENSNRKELLIIDSEVGHLSIDYNGNECYCGNRGCLETYCSVSNILALIKSQLNNDNITFSECMKLSETNSSVDNILREVIDKLAAALVTVSNVLNPSCFFIGDEGSNFSDKYLELLKNKVNTKKLNKIKSIQILRSKFLTKTHQFGSACIAVNALLSN